MKAVCYFCGKEANKFMVQNLRGVKVPACGEHAYTAVMVGWKLIKMDWLSRLMRWLHVQR